MPTSLQPAADFCSSGPFSLQGLLCGVLQVIVQKLSESDEAKAGVLQYADHIMDALLRVFACRKATVHEEAMLAVVSRGGIVGWLGLGRTGSAACGWPGGEPGIGASCKAGTT